MKQELFSLDCTTHKGLAFSSLRMEKNRTKQNKKKSEEHINCEVKNSVLFLNEHWEKWKTTNITHMLPRPKVVILMPKVF